MTHRASLSQRLMFIYKRPALLSMTLPTGFILARHRQIPRRFHYIHSVRVMAFYTVHLSLGQRMVLRQVELRVRLQVAAKTRPRVLARINDEISPPSPGGNMQTARSVAGFTP